MRHPAGNSVWLLVFPLILGAFQPLWAATSACLELASTPNPAVLGQPVTITATVTSGAAAGTVAFYAGTTFLGVGSVSGVSASLTTILLPSGAGSLTAYYGGDANCAAGFSQPLPQTVNAVLSGPFAASVPYADGTDAVALAAGDFNGDGIADLVTANYSGTVVNVLLGNGNGTFGAAVSQGDGFGPYSVAAGDFNGDGKADLAVGDVVGTVSILLGNGNGTFHAPTPSGGYPVAGIPLNLKVADFNGDGKADLVIANNSSDTVNFLLGNGDGTFTAGASYPAPTNLWSVAVGDFNGDGKPDVVAVDNSGGNNVTILLGNGDGTFTVGASYAAGTDLKSVAVADFNGDGKSDLAVAGFDENVYVLLGNGDGTFQAPVGYGVDIEVRGIAAGEFNGDGNIDLAVAGFNGTGGFASVLPGNGNGTFGASVDYPIAADPFTPYAVVTGAFAGDGRADLAVAGANGQGVYVLPPASAVPDLVIAVTNQGNFTQGQTGAVYTITASNIGAAPTSGTVSATDTLPAGLTATAISGSGWNCTLATLTCTRSDALAVQSAYPAITLLVNVAVNEPSGITDTATVSGGGESNTANDTASDTTGVQAAPVVIASASLPTATVGIAYSAQLSASGGTPPYSNWTVSAGSLPPGLVLNAGTGLIGGTPTSAAGAPFTFSVTVQDSASRTSAPQPFTIAITPALTVTSGLLAAGEVSASYSAGLTASGGAPPYLNWVVSAGSLPPGLTLNAGTGAIGGAPTSAVGSPFAFSVTVQDSAGTTSPAQAFSIAIAPRVTVTAAAPPGGEVNAFYSLALSAASGVPPYGNWAVSTGSLPPGLTLNATTGLINGTPTSAAGSPFAVSVTVNDTRGATSAALGLSISIAPQVAVSAASLAAGVVGAAYSATLVATGGLSSYSNWALSAGSLPPGLTLNAGTGAIGGTPTTAAGSPFSFSVTVKDSPGNTSAAQAFSIAIAPSVTVTAAQLPAGEVNASYSTTMAATGGVPPYSNWTVSAGSLPPGLALNAISGVIIGTPMNAAGSPFAFSVTVKDSEGNVSAAQAFSISVNSAVTVAPSALPGGVVGAAYSTTLAVSGGSAPYSNWTVTAGSLPAGLTLNAATGVINGTPTNATGSPFSFNAAVRDSAGSTSLAQGFSITIAPVVAVTATTLPVGEVGAAYSTTLGVTGGIPPYHLWTVSAGSLPPGLTLGGLSGVIGGSPTTAAGSPFSFSVTVQDSVGDVSAAQAFSIAVSTVLTVTTTSAPSGAVGSVYATTLAASGGTSPYSNWVVSGGSLPAGLTLNAATGAIGGTPTSAAGSPFNFTVTVSDHAGATSAAQALSIAITPQVTVATVALPGSEVFAVYSATLAASGGIPPYSNWTVSAGSLPPGLTLNAGTGMISGTPASTVGSPFGFSVTVRDAGGATSAAQALSIAIGLPVTVSFTLLPVGEVGVVYSATLGASGTAPYSNWTVTGGTPPPGLTLNAGTGVIGGTPTNAAGSPFSFSVTVKDSLGNTSAGQAFSITIAPAVAVPAAALPAGEVNASYSAALAATGGVPPYSNWAVSAGSPPPGLALNAATGVIAGIPSGATGSPFAFSVTVKDSLGNASAVQALSITVISAVTVTPAVLSGGVVGDAYQANLAVSGGSAPYGNWVVSSGALPPGLTLNAATGAIGGTPVSAVGSPFGFNVTVRDAGGITSAPQSFSIAVAPVVTVTAASLPGGIVGYSYQAALGASGGAPPYSHWTVSAGALPPGLSLNAAIGLVSGIPASATGSPFGFSVTVQDSVGNVSAAQALSVTVAKSFAVTFNLLPAGSVGVPYSTTLAVTGGVPPYSNWTVSSGSLPPGLTLDPVAGVISGTPAGAAGSPFSFYVTVTDTTGNTSTAQLLVIAISNSLAVTTASLPGGVVGSAYSATLTASGGTTPYANWTFLGSLPPGLTLTAATGVISGTPTSTVGSPFLVAVSVTDAAGIVSPFAPLSIAIVSAVSVTPVTLPPGTVGANYSVTLAATGGASPYGNWTVTTGSLPLGLSLNAATGVISGVPGTATGSPFNFQVTVTDHQGAVSAPRNLSIAVSLNTAPPQITQGGIGPIYSHATTIQSGSWISIYGTNLATTTATWNGDFPTSLGGVTVTIDGKLAYLWFVSPTQINLQAPNDTATGPVSVVLTNANGSFTTTVTLGAEGPSLSLFGDGKHVAGVIPTPNGSGAYASGTYDLVGPVGAFNFSTRPVNPGEVLVLFGVGFGPTNPAVLAGQLFSGAATTVLPVTFTIGGLPAKVAFSGITEAGLYQFNLTVPKNAGSGDQVVQATVNGVTTPVGPVVTIQ